MSGRRPEFREVDANPELAALNDMLTKTTLPALDELVASLANAEEPIDLSSGERSYVLSFAGEEVTGLELAFAFAAPYFSDAVDPDTHALNSQAAFSLIEEGHAAQDAVRQVGEMDDEYLGRKLSALQTVFNCFVPDPVVAAPGNEIFDSFVAHLS